MARIWKEQRHSHWSEHFDLHGYLCMPGHDVSADPTLVPVWTYCVRVCGFTFRFGSVAQIDVALAYYQEPIHPSSRRPRDDMRYLEHDVCQRWYERVPLRLQKECNRVKVVAALEHALTAFADYRNSYPVKEISARNLPLIRPSEDRR